MSPAVFEILSTSTTFISETHQDLILNQIRKFQTQITLQVHVYKIGYVYTFNISVLSKYTVKQNFRFNLSI